MSNLSNEHWTIVIWVFKYLTRTINYGLHYERYLIVLVGCCDANWISDSKGSKSISRYVFTLGNVTVS